MSNNKSRYHTTSEYTATFKKIQQTEETTTKKNQRKHFSPSTIMWIERKATLSFSK